MTTRQFGASVKRNEDARLLAGRAQFVDDVKLPGILHAAFVRSPHAHARIVAIDVTAALARESSARMPPCVLRMRISLPPRAPGFQPMPAF